jgi:thioredoxin-dependent peroxiredoxin
MSIELNQTVPDFSALSTSGTFLLRDLRGKNVVLYFYPKDNTPGCTTESLAFRDQYTQFCNANTEIVGVSRDSVKSHEGFKAKFNLPFPLISDPDATLCTLFDVIKNKTLYGKLMRGIERSTFLLDANGTLRDQWRGVKVTGHVDEVLRAVWTLQE